MLGIACGALPRQINYLTYEAGDSGKGVNAVVSLFHYFFDNVYLHADSCTRQNKNNCMIQYLLQHTITNQHTTITLLFLPVGHTKFAPDWSFGLFKRSYRRTKVGSYLLIAQVVNRATQLKSDSHCSRNPGRRMQTSYHWLVHHMGQALINSGTCTIQSGHFAMTRTGR